MNHETTLENVKEYYDKTLQSSKDLATNACCTDDIPAEHREILKKIAPEIIAQYYGCGSPHPPALSGRKSLDLGCGTGRDVYLLSNLVGETGHVTGIDMTDSQLETAIKYQDFHRDAFGFSESNVTFKKGYIEDLSSAGIADNSLDLVVSNCVINLSPSKDRVYREIFRVLKPGGELYISDVFAARRIPESLRKDPMLYGECLSGALYSEDFRRILQEVGIRDFRIVSRRQLTINNPEVEKRLEGFTFYSSTIRAFKLDFEDRCEDYGQVATYLGTIPNHPNRFILDDHHVFEAHKPMLVCGNTHDMVAKSHYAPFFKVEGDTSRHFGLFDCGETPVVEGGGCC